MNQSGKILLMAIGAVAAGYSLFLFFSGERIVKAGWEGGWASPLALVPLGVWLLVYGLLGVIRKKHKSE